MVPSSLSCRPLVLRLPTCSSSPGNVRYFTYPEMLESNALEHLWHRKPGSILFHLYEILARVHGLLVLDKKPGDAALFLGLDLVERFHDLDQADGISGRDLVALLDVGVALRIGTTVEGAWHLRSNGLVGQLTSSFRSRDSLLYPT